MFQYFTTENCFFLTRSCTQRCRASTCFIRLLPVLAVMARAAAENRRDGDRDTEQKTEDEQRRSCLTDVVSLVVSHLLRKEARTNDVTLVVLDPAALHVGPLFALTGPYQLHNLVPRNAINLLLSCHLHLQRNPTPGFTPTISTISRSRMGTSKLFIGSASDSSAASPLEFMIRRPRIVVVRLCCAHNINGALPDR